MKYLKIWDRVKAFNDIDGWQNGTVSSQFNNDKKGVEQKVYCDVECDNSFTNAKVSISLDSRIENNDTLIKI